MANSFSGQSMVMAHDNALTRQILCYSNIKSNRIKHNNVHIHRVNIPAALPYMLHYVCLVELRAISFNVLFYSVLISIHMPSQFLSWHCISSPYWCRITTFCWQKFDLQHHLSFSAEFLYFVSLDCGFVYSSIYVFLLLSFFYSLVNCNCLVYLLTLHRDHDADQTKIETTTTTNRDIYLFQVTTDLGLNIYTYFNGRLLCVQTYSLRWSEEMKEKDTKHLKRIEEEEKKQKCQNDTKSKWFVLLWIAWITNFISHGWRGNTIKRRLLHSIHCQMGIGRIRMGCGRDNSTESLRKSKHTVAQFYRN